jgi:Amt family ammonium transporter
MGVISYYAIGFNTHYPGDFNGFFKLGGPLTNAFTDTDSFANLTSEYADYTYWSDFLFQAMFAATAATIVSGAVAERVKLSAFIVHATILVAIGYTVAGSWHWGGGFLTQLGDALDADGNMIAAAALEAGAEVDSYSNAFYDFAGSTVVHAFGGFAALAFVMVLGPRKGKYTENGIKPIVGHSMPLAAIGVFLLFLGWFGFNGGSVLSADAEGVSRVCVTTALAACAGALASMLVSTFVIKKPDLSMALNGFLAGLVGITAGADAISPAMSIVTGAIAGAIVVFSIIAFDKAKIDDPVGAISVHGICGIWGTLAVAFFGGASLTGQIIGIVCVSLFAFVFSYALALILKSTIGVRVSEEEEDRGLDISEHGQEAYSF